MKRHASLVFAVRGIAPVRKTEVMANESTQQPRSRPTTVDCFVFFPHIFRRVDRGTSLDPQGIYLALSLEDHFGDVSADLGDRYPQLRILDLPDVAILKLGRTDL